MYPGAALAAFFSATGDLSIGLNRALARVAGLTAAGGSSLISMLQALRVRRAGPRRESPPPFSLLAIWSVRRPPPGLDETTIGVQCWACERGARSARGPV